MVSPIQGPKMKTTIPNESGIVRSWFVVDAADKVLGRLAVKIADIVSGKNKVNYTPHIDLGDFVVVINAAKIKLTGKKEEQKLYVDYSGFRGGHQERKASVIRAIHPERLISDAVKRMLPKNRLMRKAFKRVLVYPQAEHPHQAQQPRVLEL
jgi:large subunit ribosomal protein L13